MHKGVLTILVFVIQVLFVNGQSITKVNLQAELICSGSITDICVSGDEIFVGTENGFVDVVSIEDLKLLDKISLPKIVDFMGDSINPGVYSVDSKNGEILIVSQGKSGFSNVLVFKGSKTKQLIDSKKRKIPVKKASFVDNNKILLATVGNELILMDLNNSSIIYQVQISPYTFSDYVLSKDRTRVFTTDESGIVHQLKVADGQLISEFQGNNVDYIYQLDFKSDIILTGGKDRRTGVYNIVAGTSYYFQNDFLILCVALSPEGKYGAFMSSEKGSFTIFDILTKEILIVSDDNEAPLSDLIFLDKDIVLSANERAKLSLWKLK